MIYTLSFSMYYSALCKNKRDASSLFKNSATNISQKCISVSVLLNWVSSSTHPILIREFFFVNVSNVLILCCFFRFFGLNLAVNEKKKGLFHCVTLNDRKLPEIDNFFFLIYWIYVFIDWYCE